MITNILYAFVLFNSALYSYKIITTCGN